MPLSMDLDSQPITPQAASPAISIEAFPPSTQPVTDDMLPSTQEYQDYQDQGKYSSTPPPSSSITPPPSSQPPPSRAPPVSNRADGSMHTRTVTPKPSLLSSPPPTVTDSTIPREFSTRYVKPSQAMISQSSRSDMEVMLGKAMAEIDRLILEARESRMSVAHFQLQLNLLRLDTEETIKRMDVEHEMARREVNALQVIAQHRQAREEPKFDPEYVSSLQNYSEEVTEDLSLTRQRLHKAKRALRSKDEVISCLSEENGRLLKRIRENREHLSQLRSPGGIFAANTPRTFPSTPQQYRETPKHTPATNRSRARDGSQQPFAALLLADQVLREGKDRGMGSENPHNSAPSTPQMSRTAVKRHQVNHGHTRAVHSLSSLPTTPVRSSYSTNQESALLPAAQLVAQSEPRYRTTVGLNGSFSDQRASSARHRKSRDSTISASDEEGGYHGDRGDDDMEGEIQESQASRSATAMLRRDPRESFEVVGTPSLANTLTASEVGAKSNLLQAKIFGTVTKPGVEKRKRGSDADINSPQKTRKLGEGVGLGIGGLGSSQL